MQPAPPQQDVPPEVRGRPIGAGRTLLLGLGVGVLYLAIQTAVAFVMVRHGYAEVGPGQTRIDGDLLGAPLVATTVLLMPLLYLLARMQDLHRPGAYLGFRRAPVPASALAVVGGMGVVLVFELIRTYVLEYPMSEFMVHAYETAELPLLLWLGVVIGAPLFEETFFRGFLYTGFRQSRLGHGGAIVITSLLFMLVHPQYAAFDRFTVLTLGFVMGAMRAYTGSVWPCIALHLLNNFTAMVQTALR